MAHGSLALILHAHLPFVRHPEHETSLEEDWFFEAMSECYIPLLQVFEGLVRDAVSFRITISLSPPLLTMMTDPLLQTRYIAKLESLIALSYQEMQRTQGQPDHHRLARHYHQWFSRTRELFIHHYDRNPVEAFKYLQNSGKIEIITTAATHGYLPLLAQNPQAQRAQVSVALDLYRQLFGRPAQGFWLPECGYDTGLDTLLKEHGITYFVLETHGVLHASQRPQCGVFAPLCCPAGIAAFGRDALTSRQVWSARDGYPGDADYREFYRDIGHDLAEEDIAPYLPAHGIRTQTGIKYYRITGGDSEKQLYNPEAAREKAREHAEHFIRSKIEQAASVQALCERTPVIVAPFDAELFGHWWYEGPLWLDGVLRCAAARQNDLQLITPSDYLNRYPDNQQARPAASSWGWQGYNEAWVDPVNDWIYPRLHRAADCLTGLARRHITPDDTTRRALNQAARELLLAQSSDWAFMMKAGTTAEYAVKRTREHLENVMRIEDTLKHRAIDIEWLRSLEERHNIFPDIDYRVYA
ncbi:MAG: DUF1957 domain-containing protein [Deltaproteobacteria bacterium]|nr:DUF1957 domain-containing protein [Deltaproteobacteria bacterium]